MKKTIPYISTCYSSTYIYNDSLERVYEVFNKPELLEKAQEQYSIEIQRTRNPDDLFDSIGATFIYTVKNGMCCTLLVEDSKNEENYKMIQISSLKVYPLNCIYRMKLSFYWCNLTKQTVLYEEVCFFHRKDPDLEELFPYYHSQMVLKAKLIENFLREFTFNLNQCESVIINVPYKEVSNILNDWTQFVRLSPDIAEEVQIKSDPKQIGGIIVLLNRKERSFLTVVKNEESPPNEKRFYDLVLSQKNKKAPKQFVKFSVIKIREEITFLSFMHEFIDPIRFTTISKMEKIKRKILRDLKINMESIYKCKG